MNFRLCYSQSDRTAGPPAGRVQDAERPAIEFEAFTPDGLRSALAALWTGKQAGLEVQPGGDGDDWLAVALLTPGDNPTLPRCAGLLNVARHLLARRREVLDAMRKAPAAGTFCHLAPRAHVCAVCHVNPVEADAGFDTCQDCLGRQ
jgi:hypothetical protein